MRLISLLRAVRMDARYVDETLFKPDGKHSLARAYGVVHACLAD